MFVALLMVGCGGVQEGAIDLDDNETLAKILAVAIESRYVDDASTEDGMRLYRVPDKLKLVEDLRSGKISREELSDLQSETELLTGWCKRFHPNGQVASLHQAENGKVLAAWSWYQSGEKHTVGKLKDGKMWTAVSWKPNGKQCPVTNVVNGNGVVVRYKEDGTEDYRLTYKDGEIVRD